MSFDRFETIFGQSHTYMIPLDPIYNGPAEMASLRYYTVDSLGNFSDESTRLFGSPRSVMVEDGISKLDEFENLYFKKYSGGFLDLLITHDIAIYRPLAIVWSSIDSLGLKEPTAPGTSNLYREHSNIDIIAPSDFLDAENYRKSLKQNARFGILIRNLRLQMSLTADVKMPFNYPYNPHIGLFHLTSQSFLNNFKWLEDQDIPLANWTRSVMAESQNHIFNFLDGLKSSCQKFKVATNLEDEELWVRGMGEPSYYIENLRVYIELISMVLDVSMSFSRKIWKEYSRSQFDLVTLTEKIMDL